MSQSNDSVAVAQRTITIRYTPATRCIVYDKFDKLLSPSDVKHLLKTLNRARISTVVPTKPKGGEVYAYRSRIIGKTWRNDGYERCWLSNGTHYYPKAVDTRTSKQNAILKVIRHVAIDRDTNARGEFKRVAFLEQQKSKDNPVMIVQYFGDETRCSPDRPHGNVTHGQSQQRRRKVQRRQLVVESPECEVVELMDIGGDIPSAAAAGADRAVGSTSLDEDLREASALGDADRVSALIGCGAGVNSVNRMNGWTALHWASKRSYADVVSLLLGRGADPGLRNMAGQTPGDLASCQKIARLLGSPAAAGTSGPAAEFVPNYLRNPEFPYAKATGGGQKKSLELEQQPLLLQARVAKSRDPDFIEVELAIRTYPALVELLCRELGLDAACVERIRKLPNVRLRNDRDVGRLECGQQLEIVLREF